MEQGPVAAILEIPTAIALGCVAVQFRSALPRLATQVKRRAFPPPPMPEGRPIELIAMDARRLRRRFRYPPPGLRFAKYEGLRRAYDAVLAEGCSALGHAHLFDLLPPGTERDVERERVEDLLDEYGFHLQDVS